MATVNNPMGLEGKAGGLSFYTRRDSDKTFVRTAGGASAKKIREAPSMAGTRRVNAEFGGRATASRFIMDGLWPLKILADYNIAGNLNKLLAPIQAMDTENPPGQRAVCISKAAYLLEGFTFNRRRPFGEIICNPVPAAFQRSTGLATLSIPALLPGVNFIPPPGKYPLFGFIFTSAVVPDLFYSNKGYRPVGDKQSPPLQVSYSAWFTVGEPCPATSLQMPAVAAGSPAPGEHETVILAAGIRFGRPLAGGEVEQIKYAGAAKILAAG